MKYKIGDEVEFTDYWTMIKKGKIIDTRKIFFFGNQYRIRYAPHKVTECAEWIDEDNIINILK